MRIVLLVGYGLLLIHIIYLLLTNKVLRAFLHMLLYLLIGEVVIDGFVSISKPLYITFSVLLVLLIGIVNYTSKGVIKNK
ncbi:hypothetical protein IAI10_16120 [Clostridium sp. 19966]|uniref:hypothetical protein n=1 Tax=Clostridium sp. 19966 TaxID=2768166 RepID=UPI0028DF89E3|nr:hypothetical protein [Clostridium sp. 19966]MDT8718193.1 hypothetical protein [Clostridium sp. 19966]